MLLFLNFARSGGTLINRVLLSLPNIVMLSEVGEYGGGWGADGINSPTSVKSQAKKWYGIFIKSTGFFDELIELDNYCKNNGKTLIVREWIYSYYFKNYYVKNPNREIRSLNLLKEYIKSIIIFVRDGIDVWISNGCPQITSFYRRYNEILDVFLSTQYPIYKYEDFTYDPVGTIKTVCSYHGLNYQDFTNKWYNEMRVNGDSQLNIFSSSFTRRTIKRPNRRIIPLMKALELMNNPEFRLANKRMGYSINYFKSCRYFQRILQKIFEKNHKQ